MSFALERPVVDVEEPPGDGDIFDRQGTQDLPGVRVITAVVGGSYATSPIGSGLQRQRGAEFVRRVESDSPGDAAHAKVRGKQPDIEQRFALLVRDLILQVDVPPQNF